jgi:hypothetical protein
MSARRKRAVALAIVVILVGAVLATPAQAHFTQSISHIIDHAKKVFYTKSQSNERFVNVGEKASDADKLDGLDSTAFLPADGQAADADAVDGFDSSDFLLTSDAADFARKLGNVVTVSPSGGDFDSIQDAVDSIDDSDQSNPYLLVVGPGFYSEQVTLKDGITLQGAGPELTRISTVGADDCADGYGIKTATGSVIRDLYVTVSSGACGVGVLNVGNLGNPVRLYNVKIQTDLMSETALGISNQGGQVFLQDGDVQTYGLPATDDTVAIGIDQSGGSFLTLSRSTVNGTAADAETHGIHNDGSSASIENSTVTAGLSSSRVAILNQNGSGQSVVVKRSSIAGVTAISSGANYFVTVSLSNLDGPVTGGNSTCTANVDGSMQWLETTCPS